MPTKNTKMNMPQVEKVTTDVIVEPSAGVMFASWQLTSSASFPSKCSVMWNVDSGGRRPMSFETEMYRLAGF